MIYLIVFVNIIVNVFLWVFCPAILALIHFFVCFVTLFVWHVEHSSIEWAKTHNKEKEKPQKVGRFDFLKFALKDIYK